MILYLDASALVKCFVMESFSDLVEKAASNADAILTSRIAYVEACAAFGSARRMKRLTPAESTAARKELDRQWPHFRVIELDEMRSGILALKHGLRALDAIHLAAALEIRISYPEATITFCSFDDRQRKAAISERLLLTPERIP